MKNTIYKTLVFSSLILVAISMTSCYGCRRRKWQKEKKQEEMLFKETSGKIEKFIADRQYDEARVVARTIDPEKHDYVNGDNIYWQTYYIKMINKAQLSNFIADGNWEDAQDLAMDLGAEEEFIELFKSNFNKLLRTHRYDLVFNTLPTIPFKYHYRDHVTNTFQASDGNSYYNSEVNDYNNLVDALLQQLILDEETNKIKKCFALYKPEAVVVKTEDKGNAATFKLENKALQRAKGKVKEAGITIK